MTARPRGREAAVDALVSAARELFAEHGPDAVSLRDVARRAGVNHGLIHHYIGTRDDLVRLVFAASTDRARNEIATASDPLDAIRALRRVGSDDGYTRLLAWALLEGRDPAEFHGRSAALDAVVTAAGTESHELRVALAMAMVQTLGWKLFGRYAVAAAGLSPTELDAVRDESNAMVDRLVAQAAVVST